MTAPRRLGKYELVAKIGEGGMAEVYLARQRGPRKFQKLVVVKTVHPKLASKPALAEALLDEARIAALVKHPNVVDIYDLGEEKGTYFIAMEYLEGESLAAVLMASRVGPRLDPFSTARIIADGAAGLHAAHELRDLSGAPLELVHQDVTPGNVIVLYGGQVKLVDFGVAKVSTSQDVGLVKGKAGYLAPELFDGASADRRCDVWSLGVVLWESLTLRRLFGVKSEEETFQRIRTMPILPPSRQALAVTSDLDDVCLKALARDPTARYQTARDMHDDLMAVLRAANWSSDSEPIARFMRTAFASQIIARREVLRELGKRERLSPETIGRMSAPGDEAGEGTPPGTEEVVSGSHGAVRIESPAAAEPPAAHGELELLEGSAVQMIGEPPARRRRVVAIAIGLAALAAVVAIVAVVGGGSKPRGEVVAAIGGSAMEEPSPAAIDAAVVVEAVEATDAAEPVVAVEVDAAVTAVPPGERPDEKRDRDRDRDARPQVPSTSARSLYKDGLGKFVAGDTGAAINRFLAALDRDPRYAPAHRGLGMAYERKGERSRAARSFRRYLELAPDASDAAQIRARLAKL
jgi:serine/threonine-protein kinase